MWQDTFTAISLGFFLAFTIGPVFFVLIETSISEGFRKALLFDIGVILGDIFFILLAFFTTSDLLNQVKNDPRLFIFGGIFLFSYGIFSLTKEKQDYKKKKEIIKTETNFKSVNNLKLIIKGFLLNAINIGVLGFWLGIIITFTPRLNMEPKRIFYFFSIIILSYLLTDIIKILIAKKIRNKLTKENIHIFKIITSLIIIIFGLFLTIQGFFQDIKEEILHFIS